MTLRSPDLKLLYDVAVALPESDDGEEAAILTDGLTLEVPANFGGHARTDLSLVSPCC